MTVKELTISFEEEKLCINGKDCEPLFDKIMALLAEQKLTMLEGGALLQIASTFVGASLDAEHGTRGMYIPIIAAVTQDLYPTFYAAALEDLASSAPTLQ